MVTKRLTVALIIPSEWMPDGRIIPARVTDALHNVAIKRATTAGVALDYMCSVDVLPVFYSESLQGWRREDWDNPHTHFRVQEKWRTVPAP